MSEISDSATLTGRDIDGHPVRFDVKADQVLTLSTLDTQRVRTQDGSFLIRRSLPDGSARALLDNEICALARLNRAFRGDRPWPFPRLLAYDMDSADPWALVSDYRGVPARTAVNSMMSGELWEFTASVFDAVAHLAAVGVAHNGLDLDIVYVAGSTVQITTFERAALFGEPRLDGERAGSTDDLPDAARLAYEAYTGTRHDRPDLADEVAALRSPLAGVFDVPRRRPPVDEVVRRLGRRSVPEDPSAGSLDGGRAAFDQARRRKVGPSQPTVRTTPVPQPQARRKRGWFLIAALLLASVVVFGIAEVVA